MKAAWLSTKMSLTTGEKVKHTWLLNWLKLGTIQAQSCLDKLGMMITVLAIGMHSFMPIFTKYSWLDFNVEQAKSIKSSLVSAKVLQCTQAISGTSKCHTRKMYSGLICQRNLLKYSAKWPFWSLVYSSIFKFLFASIWKFDTLRFETTQPHSHLLTYTTPPGADIGS
jgi:hypothetical protein